MPPENQPTVEDVTAIGNAAQGAAVESVETGGTPDDAGAAAAAAAQAEADSRGITLPKEVIDQIAKATATVTVAELASQGALMPPAPVEPPAEPAAPAPEPDAGGVVEDMKPKGGETFADRFLSCYRK